MNLNDTIMTPAQFKSQVKMYNSKLHKEMKELEQGVTPGKNSNKKLMRIIKSQTSRSDPA